MGRPLLLDSTAVLQEHHDIRVRLNCVNCGAPYEPHRCSYCGSAA